MRHECPCCHQDTEAECQRDALLTQLPDGMKHCTILFRECRKGHGWLTATNWIDHGCPTCQRDLLLEAAREAYYAFSEDPDCSCYEHVVDGLEAAMALCEKPQEEGS